MEHEKTARYRNPASSSRVGRAQFEGGKVRWEGQQRRVDQFDRMTQRAGLFVASQKDATAWTLIIPPPPAGITDNIL